jgi:hypothetical protein
VPPAHWHAVGVPLVPLALALVLADSQCPPGKPAGQPATRTATRTAQHCHWTASAAVRHCRSVLLALPDARAGTNGGPLHWHCKWPARRRGEEVLRLSPLRCCQGQLQAQVAGTEPRPRPPLPPPLGLPPYSIILPSR